MSANTLRQWLKVARKQAKQLRQSLDDELQGFLEKNIPKPQRSLVRLPVAVNRRPPFRHGNRFVHTSAKGGVNPPHASPPFRNQSPRFTSCGGNTLLASFNSTYRAPKGTPRGLFTNWNMNTARFTNGRAYSTSAIRITHDAVQNMAISLRCFYNLWDDYLLGNGLDDKTKLKSRVSNFVNNGNLSPKGVSLLRTKELCRMIEDHKQELGYDNFKPGEEMGCVVEFQMPCLEMAAMPSMVFASDEALDMWHEELAAYNIKIRTIEESVRTIYEHYGALPLEFDKRSVRVRFPNITTYEAEMLMRDLGLTLGLVLPAERHSGSQGYLNERHGSYVIPREDVEQNPGGEFAPVLSSPSLSASQYSGFSLLSSYG
ncbi:LADA_0F13102g1_1 [Lachancea dasiensis]|uniref:LADA_0F13102g1_1 n=1 Tax=Lachancea dasiensis TaxID=1072105 RepID=A0A1G4JMS2_9SACH|nr:LADA_0F13102g1_1 [Lachancea dasiensis]